MRKLFFKKLLEFTKKDKDIFILFGDLGNKFFSDFQKLDPKRFINVGVSEQNMIGLAAGLAMSGKNVFCYSIVPFITMRALEQIRVDLCKDNLNVKLLGAGGGVCYGLEGVTHHALEDIGILRTLPNMTIVSPCDSVSTEALAGESISHKGPLYVRFGRDQETQIYDKKINFKIGKGIVVKKGKDICLISFSTMLYNSKAATEILEKKGINAGLVDMHTIKPIDANLIRKCAQEYKAIFTIEDHNIIGGLGSAVSEILSEYGYGGKFKRIGIKDCYCKFSGKPDYLMRKLGLNAEGIADNILKSINKK
jgi:transketolase